MNDKTLSDQNRDDLRAVLEKHPDLKKNGFVPWFSLSGPPDHHAEIVAAQTAFLEGGGVYGFGRARRWLAGRARRKTVNRNHSSYHWKHVAESAEGAYVSNGALIAAALADGFPVGRVSGALNAWIGIGRKLTGGAKPLVAFVPQVVEDPGEFGESDDVKPLPAFVPEVVSADGDLREKGGAKAPARMPEPVDDQCPPTQENQ